MIGIPATAVHAHVHLLSRYCEPWLDEKYRSAVALLPKSVASLSPSLSAMVVVAVFHVVVVRWCGMELERPISGILPHR